jgi:peptide/nickel transport system permease protein
MTTQELTAQGVTRPRAQVDEEQTTLGQALRQRRRRWRVPPLILVCWVVVLGFAAAAIFAGTLSPHDPIENNLRARLLPPLWMTGADPAYALGTDSLGRDLLSRLIYGARVSLAIGFAGTLIGLAVGGLSGLVSGFIGGMVDEVMMFLVDALVALPFLVVALTVIAIFGSSLTVLVLLSGFSGWTAYTRLARGQVLTVSRQPYVTAAQSVGASSLRVMLWHIAPNIAAPLVVLAAMTMTSIILLESSLSFLGLGIQPPTPAWGAMLGDGRNYLHTAWWIGVFPGVAIMLLTMAISLIGDWLRDVLDPTLSGL